MLCNHHCYLVSPQKENAPHDLLLPQALATRSKYTVGHVRMCFFWTFRINRMTKRVAFVSGVFHLVQHFRGSSVTARAGLIQDPVTLRWTGRAPRLLSSADRLQSHFALRLQCTELLRSERPGFIPRQARTRAGEPGRALSWLRGHGAGQVEGGPRTLHVRPCGSGLRAGRRPPRPACTRARTAPRARNDLGARQRGTVQAGSRPAEWGTRGSLTTHAYTCRHPGEICSVCRDTGRNARRHTGRAGGLGKDTRDPGGSGTATPFRGLNEGVGDLAFAVYCFMWFISFLFR